ncbi:MAG: LTA synthase family protein [Lachnospiraceae bacterium]
MNDEEKKLRAIRKLAVCLLVAVSIDLVIELISRRDIVSLLQFIVYSPIAFAVNVNIIFCTVCFCFLFKRRIFMLALLSSVWIIMGVINGILLGFHLRTTPLTGQDLRLIGSALELAPKYLSPPLIAGFILLVAVLAAGVVFVYRKAPVYKEKIHLMRNGLMWAGFIWFSLILSNFCVNIGVFPTNFSNIGEAYQQYGFAYCFANSLLNTGISKPEGYNSELMEEIAENNNLRDFDEILSEIETSAPELPSSGESLEETKLDETINQTIEEMTDGIVEETTQNTMEETKPSQPNIIFIQLESFFDITNAVNLSFSQDPIANFHKLSRTYSSGYVSVPSIGAGTANTEFEVLTGMNLDFFGPGEYPYKTILKKVTCESIAYDLLELGWSTHVIHNNNATFYDRIHVFPKLGFETFTSLEYMGQQEFTYGGWAKDEGLIIEILKALNSTKEADFIYTISVQGHGSYPEESVLENPVITVSGEIEEGRKNAIEYYVNQIYEMDLFVTELIEELNQIEENTVLVLFGDHLPTLNFTEEEIENATLFETPYVIWDNIDLEKQDRNLEAYQLTSWVLQQLGVHQGIMTRFHQSYLQQDEADEEKYLQNMEMLEYDMLYGEKDIFDGENPYEVLDMKMGINDVVIHSVVAYNDGLFVEGENFTPYTQVSINGKLYESEALFQNLLLVKEVELQETNTIMAVQVDKDGVILSESGAYTYHDREFETVSDEISE